jgi:hypothetical protein
MTATISRKTRKIGKPLPAVPIARSEMEANHRLIPRIGIDAGRPIPYRTEVGTAPRGAEALR